MYSLTSVISSGVRIRFGIFGCELVRNTRRAVAVIPGVFATSRKAVQSRSFSEKGLGPDVMAGLAGFARGS